MSASDPYDAASQLLTFALDCLQVRGRCDGVISYISPGVASYECDQLTARIFNEPVDYRNVCNTFYNIGVELQLVRCCVPVGTDKTPPTPAEIDAAAKCIYADLQSVFECLVCEASAIQSNIGTINCDGLDVQGIEFDNAPAGTCFGGRIKVSVKKIICC